MVDKYRVLVGCHNEGGETYQAETKNDIVKSDKPLDQMFANKFMKLGKGATAGDDDVKDAPVVSGGVDVTGEFTSAVDNPGFVVKKENATWAVYYEGEKISDKRLARGKVNPFIDAWIEKNFEDADEEFEEEEDESEEDEISDDE